MRSWYSRRCQNSRPSTSYPSGPVRIACTSTVSSEVTRASSRRHAWSCSSAAFSAFHAWYLGDTMLGARLLSSASSSASSFSMSALAALLVRSCAAILSWAALSSSDTPSAMTAASMSALRIDTFVSRSGLSISRVSFSIETSASDLPLTLPGRCSPSCSASSSEVPTAVLRLLRLDWPLTFSCSSSPALPSSELASLRAESESASRPDGLERLR